MRIIFAVVCILLASQAVATEDHKPFKKVDWSFEGVFGNFDRQAIQRGFKVYKEVCSVCHSLKRVAFRNLSEIGFSEEEVKAIAAGYTVQDGPNDEGEMFERPGKPSDYFPSPYANDKAARAASNNGALPPDQSLIVKAREDGANYIYSLLTGYETPPADFQLGENMHYNPYYASGGSQFSMIPPLLKDDQVEYVDGTKATVDQMAKDVVNFLQWASEPEMEQRKGLGFKVLIFMAIFTLVFYFAKKSIWNRVK
jgi:ubiquinol-cytochrome c reductase cytochrome c1 subunit